MLESLLQKPEDDAVHPEHDAVHPEYDAVHPEYDAVHPEHDAVHPEHDAVHPEQHCRAGLLTCWQSDRWPRRILPRCDGSSSYTPIGQQL